MNTAPYGRIVFGASTVLFGVIALMWHDADTWQTLATLWALPLGATIGALLMIALIAGGAGIQIPALTRAASTVLCVVYTIFSLACVPGIIGSPGIYQEYGSFFEQFALLCGAIAVFATAQTNAAAAVLGRVARVGIGFCALSYMLEQYFYLRATAGLVPLWIPPSQMFWAVFTTVAFALAAVAILINVQARLAASLMTLMLAFFGILVWVPRLATHLGSHGNWSEFALTFLITGAAWAVTDLLAATEGSKIAVRTSG